MNLRYARRTSAGLTMIELAIALAVMAILGAIAVPSLGARLERQRLNTAAQTLAADVANARFEAARGGRPLHFSLQGGAQWCWAVSADSACPCGAKQGCQLRNVSVAEFPAVQLAETHDVVLEPSGSSQAATVATLESKRGDQLKVQVSALGRARVCAVKGTFPQLPAC